MIDEVAAAFAACEARGWASVPGALGPDEVDRLGEAVADLELQPLEASVGLVRQGGASAVCTVAGRPALEALAARLERAAAAAGVPWRPDEAATTAYGAGDGISPHRDNTFYEGFVAVVTLAGTADLRVVADRQATQELERWSTSPGHLDLFRGPRAGGEARPLHAVGPPGPGGRRILVLRRNARGAGLGWAGR